MTTPLVTTGPAPTRTTKDPSLLVGEKVVDDAGSLVAVDERQPEGLRPRTASCCTTARGTRATAATTSCPRRDEAPKPKTTTRDERPTTTTGTTSRRRRRRPARRHAPTTLSAVATASTSHSGSRVGRIVFASTHACDVQPVGDAHAVGDALEHVLVAEARAAHVEAARPDPDPVAEARGHEVADVPLDDRCLVALGLERLVAARVLVEILDARDLEPDEVVRVVDDSLRVRLREPDAYASVEKRNPSTGFTLRWCSDQGAPLRLRRHARRHRVGRVPRVGADVSRRTA